MPVAVHAGKPFYSTKEACERIGRSKSAVLEWIRSRQIEDVGRDKDGNRVWTDDDIARFRTHKAVNLQRKLNARRKHDH